MSVSIRVRRRSVRPLRYRNHELGDWLRSTIKLWIQQNRGARHAGTRSHRVRQGNVKHEMGNPVPGRFVQAPLRRDHVAHPARLECRQLLVLKFFDAVDDLIFGQPGQYQVCPLQSEWQNRSCGWWIKAERAPVLRIPKLGTVELPHPCAFYDADKAVLAFHRSFITMPPEDHNRGVAGNGRRSRCPCQIDLGVSIRYKVLIQRSHAEIWSFGVCCASWPRRA